MLGKSSLDVEYIDGTKIESKANKYTFVWRKSVEKNRNKLLDKIRILLEQIDDTIAQDKATENESLEFTSDLAWELKEALGEQPVARAREEKKARQVREKEIKELEKHGDKIAEYEQHLQTLGDRNFYSKSDPSATFMRMKEDAMNNGQTKPSYNLQIGTENKFITDFSLFPNPTDTLTLMPFFSSFCERYNRLPRTAVADSGYGSEENYRFMEEYEIQAFVKYNWFHKEQKRSFKNNPFGVDNLYYNAKDDYYVCPMGQHMTFVGKTHGKTASGYVTESHRYRAGRCEGCPLRTGCFKAKGNRSIKVNHRLVEYKRKAREKLISEEGLDIVPNDL